MKFSDFVDISPNGTGKQDANDKIVAQREIYTAFFLTQDLSNGFRFHARGIRRLDNLCPDMITILVLFFQ